MEYIRKRIAVIAIFIIAISSAGIHGKIITETGAAPAPDPAVVQTDQGAVRGVVRNEVLEFRGIPYAAAPTGERRWALPQPASTWTGVRDASQFGRACPQVARFGLTEASNEEDCLSINVSVPRVRKPGEKLPVIFWIHGGAFIGGASNLYRSDALVKGGRVIVVTANYRLGVFGFMPHPAFAAEHNGAYGLEDQRAAMRWVQRNIAAFGGNPGNVTVAGESAGAGSICVHLSSPEGVTGLFQKAIVQSAGCLFQFPSVAEGEKLGIKVATNPALGCTNPATALQCLRQAPVQALLEAGRIAAGSSVMSFSPTIGSQSVRRSTSDAVETGALVKVPIILGGTRDELRLYVGYDQQAGRWVTHENYSEALHKAYGSTPQELQRQVPEKVAQQYALTDSISAASLLGTVMSNFTPLVGINNCLYLHTGDQFSRFMPVYQFEFADQNAPVLGVSIPAKPDPKMELGAVHSSELNYLFPNMSNTSKIDAPDLAPASQELANKLVAYWTSFAWTGKPHAVGAPTWPRYKGTDTVMLLDTGRIRAYNASKQHQCSFWKSLYPDQLGG